MWIEPLLCATYAVGDSEIDLDIGFSWKISAAPGYCLIQAKLEVTGGVDGASFQ